MSSLKAEIMRKKTMLSETYLITIMSVNEKKIQ